MYAYVGFFTLQENLHKLIELQRDLVGIDNLVQNNRVSLTFSIYLKDIKQHPSPYEAIYFLL